MLYGTDEEMEYHAIRASQELALSNRCNDPNASNAHFQLASMHRTRYELATALRARRSNRNNNYIYSTDKES